MQHRLPRISLAGLKTSRAMSLIEVVIAIAVAAIVSIGLYASAIYTMRQTARNVEHMYALQIVNSAAAKVRAARFDLLTAEEDDVPNEAFEKQFFSSHVVEADPSHPASTTYTLTYKLKGYGKGIQESFGGGSGKQFDLLQPTDSAAVAKDEYKDHLLVITGGKGANQVMYIRGNNATHFNSGTGAKTVKVKMTSKLDGSSGGPGDDGFGVAPGSSSVYAIDYGMYCEVTVSWGDAEGYQTVTETVYVPTL